MMMNYNTDESIIQVIEALYKDSSSTVLLNSLLGEFFRTTVGDHKTNYYVRQHI